MRRPLALLLALISLLAACGEPEEAVTVRPFAEVQGSEFVFDYDAAGRAVFRVVTTEPMICAIVWGETEALGRFNNSLTMAGTGTTDHDVILPGAEPGTTYFFVVQGSTADGTLYRSPMQTFVLPEPDAAAATEPGPNLALGATIADVSSEFGASWVAGNAIDGDLATEWSSQDDGDDAFLVLDLGDEMPLSAVAFLTRTMGDGSATTTTFTVVVDDGERFGPFPAGTPAEPRPATLETAGRLLRFEVEDSTGGNTGAVEIRVYGR